MTAFTTNLTVASNISDSLITIYEKAFLMAAFQPNVMDGLITKQEDIGAKSVFIPFYSQIAVDNTSLTETDDVTSVAMSESGITITPAEYGAAVTPTSLAILQSGGVLATAAAEAVGNHYGRKMNLLATQVGEASANSYIAGGNVSGTTPATAVANRTFVNYFFNKLARKNIGKLNGTDYVMTAHDDVINDMRADTTTGSWVDVMKYSQPDTVLQNEVGMYAGFRVVRNNDHTFGNQAAGAQQVVDLYSCLFLGARSLAKATSLPGQIRVTGPFDKLARFVNWGWYEVSKYSILDPNAVWVGQCASSVGANAS